MNNIVAAIEYDGTMFKGSQKQPNTRTVQGSFDYSLLKIKLALPSFFSGLKVAAVSSVIGAVVQLCTPNDRQPHPTNCIKFLLFTSLIYYNNIQLDSIW